MPAVGWFWCAEVVLVGVGAAHDVGDGQGMFFAVQGDSACHLTLLTVTDGDLHVRFENSTPRELLTVPRLLNCI